MHICVSPFVLKQNLIFFCESIHDFNVENEQMLNNKQRV